MQLIINSVWIFIVLVFSNIEQNYGTLTVPPGRDPNLKMNELFIERLFMADPRPGDNIKRQSMQSKIQFVQKFRQSHQLMCEKVTYAATNKELHKLISQDIFTSQVRNEIEQDAKQLYHNLKQYQDKNPNVKEWSLEEARIVAIGTWFNTKFFRWIGSEMDCRYCKDAGIENEKMEIKANLGVTHQMFQEGLASACEFQCKYGHVDWFRRYRVQASRLDDECARGGRCGEHSDAFGGILASLGYKVRMISDDTDHVWNEIWSEHLQRWMPFEPAPDFGMETRVARLDNHSHFKGRKSRYNVAVEYDPINHKCTYEDVTYEYHGKDIADQRRIEHGYSQDTQQWIQEFLMHETR